MTKERALWAALVAVVLVGSGGVLPIHVARQLLAGRGATIDAPRRHRAQRLGPDLALVRIAFRRADTP